MSINRSKQNRVNPHEEVLFRHAKEILIRDVTRTNCENTILSERGQSQKATCSESYLHEITRRGQSTETEVDEWPLRARGGCSRAQGFCLRGRTPRGLGVWG